MPGYFNFFPTTSYANNIVTNVIAKVKFDQSVQENLAIFYLMRLPVKYRDSGRK